MISFHRILDRQASLIMKLSAGSDQDDHFGTEKYSHVYHHVFHLKFSLFKIDILISNRCRNLNKLYQKNSENRMIVFPTSMLVLFFRFLPPCPLIFSKVEFGDEVVESASSSHLNSSGFSLHIFCKKTGDKSGIWPTLISQLNDRGKAFLLLQTDSFRYQERNNKPLLSCGVFSFQISA